MTGIETSDRVKRTVRDSYGKIARDVLAHSRRASCCSEPAKASTAQALYSAQELAALPDSVTAASLGCGNPAAMADLKPGEVVLDLGSGGGIDCFLAAAKVGPTGRVIGLDMTPEMIALASANAAKMGAVNVSFRLGEMEAMPVDSDTVDVIISNCVINLSPDKDQVFAEAFRVLKPGGRMTVSDIVTRGPLPTAIRESRHAWVSCVAGALEEELYLEKIRQAGFEDVEVLSRNVVDDQSASDQVDISAEERERLLQDAQVREFLRSGILSIKVKAVKPGTVVGDR
ncbi:MAG: arsenite methyltransferase [Chloroflexota bacterium]